MILVHYKTDNIDNIPNTALTLSAFIQDGNAGTEYPIIIASVPPPGSATLTLGLAGNVINETTVAHSGKLYITRDSNNKITSIKFDNLAMTGTIDVTLSGNIVIK